MQESLEVEKADIEHDLIIKDILRDEDERLQTFQNMEMLYW